MSLLLSALDPVSLTSLNRELDKMVRHAFTQPVLRSSRTERDAAAAFAPALDLEESKDAYLVHVELPGVPADQVQVSLEGDLLRISGSSPRMSCCVRSAASGGSPARCAFRSGRSPTRCAHRRVTGWSLCTSPKRQTPKRARSRSSPPERRSFLNDAEGRSQLALRSPLRR